MSQFNSTQLLNQQSEDLKEIGLRAQGLFAQTDELNIVPQPGKWTITQVIEHLNTYNDHYLPEIEKAIKQEIKRPQPVNAVFKIGILGGYLTKIMQPDASGRVTNKTKAFKKHIPIVELDAERVLRNFMVGQERFSRLMLEAHNYDLNHIRIKITLSNLIKLKLGDLLRVLVVHQQRHFIQIAEAQALIQQNKSLQQIG